MQISKVIELPQAARKSTRLDCVVLFASTANELEITVLGAQGNGSNERQQIAKWLAAAAEAFGKEGA